MAIVNGRENATFDIERATRKFYARFKDEYAAFLGCIEGITGQTERERYASLLLNRLMFVFFLQQKGFFASDGTEVFNGDREYLIHRLRSLQQEFGDGYFHAFFQRLYHEGLGSRQRSSELLRLIGNVPYLHADVFALSPLERDYHAVHIPDQAFERVLRFFAGFEWLLDDHPFVSDRAINQDVIGAIFEKNMHQKRSGIYYTQRDVTDYISKNCLIPRLFDLVARQCPAHFEATGFVWQLLQAQPERYVYEAMQWGCTLALPPEIEAGIDQRERRTLWDERALPAWALPGETWREVVARRQRFVRLRTALANGELHSIDALITASLDISRFARDVLLAVEDVDLLAAFSASLTTLTVLDPTCGSGAFLQAALAILSPLYEACLQRIQVLVDEGQVSHMPLLLDMLRQHAYTSGHFYFIYSSIITHNLYGVDSMREATDLCKLRLFLRVALQARTHAEMDELASLDFNVWTGNTLVGFVAYRELEDASQVQFAREYLPDRFARQDRQRFEELRDVLDRSLAANYGIARQHFARVEDYEESLERWREHFQPFHWLLACADVLQRGGFEVITGNPPYVAYHQVKDKYQVRQYETQSCGNLCAYVVERALTLLNARGRCGMIMPVSTISSKSYRPLSRLLLSRHVWISSYSNRPGKLFAFAEQRLAIILLQNIHMHTLLTTGYRHWYEVERSHLFATLNYVVSAIWPLTGMPLKAGSERALAIFARMAHQQGFSLLKSQQPGAAVWVHNGPTYWVRSLPFEPNLEQKGQRSNHYRKIPVSTQETAFVLAAILSSSTFYFFYKLMSNCRDLGLKELRLFPLGELSPALFAQLLHAGQLLAQRLMSTTRQGTRRYPGGDGKEVFYCVTYEEYFPARARDVLNEIDRILAIHYGFSVEELDFLLHDNLKYRLSL